MSTHKRPTTRAKTAYGLLSTIRRLILEEPKRYNQTIWGQIVDPNMVAYAPACGTIGCVAGWSLALTAPKFFKDHLCDPGYRNNPIFLGARQVLGLSDEQANELFAPIAAGERHNPANSSGLDLSGHASRGAAHIVRFQTKYEAQLRAKKIPRRVRIHVS